MMCRASHWLRNADRSPADRLGAGFPKEVSQDVDLVDELAMFLGMPLGRGRSDATAAASAALAGAVVRRTRVLAALRAVDAAFLDVLVALALDRLVAPVA